MGVHDQLFIDRFTSIDELLHTVIDILNEIKSNTVPQAEAQNPPGEFPVRHLPFVSEETLSANSSKELLIRTDNEQGLGVSGKTGYIRNDGPGALTFTIDDGISGSSLPQTLNNGEYINFRREDNVYFDRVIISTVAGCSYRAAFTR